MKHMRNLVLSAILYASASGAGLMPATAMADDCVTKYRTECVEEDATGRCIKFERVSYEFCTPGKGPVHVGPAKEECFECYEHNKDGSCSKTRKVKCGN